MDEETEVGKDSKESLALVALSAILRYGSCRLASLGTSASRGATLKHICLHIAAIL